jgi:hypothetical protein
MTAYLAAFALARQHSAVPADQDAIIVGFAAEAAESDGTVLDTHELAEWVFPVPALLADVVFQLQRSHRFPTSIFGVTRLQRRTRKSTFAQAARSAIAQT